MSRGGAKRDRAEGPERRCIVSGETAPAAGLIRCVLAPDGAVTPDILGKLPGRGLWISADRARIAEAVAGKQFARAARQPVSVSPDLADVIESALSARVVGLVALARKAGQAVAGFEKVKGWLEDGTAVVLLQASDGSARGRAKLRPPDETGLRIDCLTGDELGLAFGRENVIHGALAAGGLTNRVVEDAARLAGLRLADRG